MDSRAGPCYLSPVQRRGICLPLQSSRRGAVRSCRLSTRVLSVVGWALTLGTVPSIAVQQPPVAPASTSSASDHRATVAKYHRATVAKYCVGCHNERMKSGGLALEAMDYDN